MSFLLALTFNNPINESVQVGDIAFFTPTTQQGSIGFITADTGNVIQLGKIVNIVKDDLETIITILDNLDNPPGSGAADPAFLPGSDDFIMFGKDKEVNTTSLIGYYAEVNFVNDSTEKIELFSVGSEISESSK